jgi:catechol 2,3-dioxygenase-like lactoylglutathione lyase family enzyme
MMYLVDMLSDKNAVANIAAKDLEMAKRFYQDILGLQLIVSNTPPEVIVFKSGNSMIIVYKSQYAGTNKATSMTWTVGDNIEEVVQALKAKGITFEHYDIPNIKLEGDIHVDGNMKVAWFKDPDGNILNLVNA